MCKFVLVRAMKACRGNRATASITPNLGVIYCEYISSYVWSVLIFLCDTSDIMSVINEDRNLRMSSHFKLKVKYVEVQLYKLQILTLMPNLDTCK